MLRSVSENDFNDFLTTLDSDMDQAAGKYIALRERLERFFEWRGCENIEELTDIVFDRVIKKIKDGEDIKNAEAFCVSISKYVLLESKRKSFRSEELDENSKDINSKNTENDLVEEEKIKDKRLKCLDKCLAKLPFEKRSLMIGYFDTDEKTMIETRKVLAKKIGTNLNSLRIRVSRIKSKLEKCTKKCCNET